MNKCFVTTVLHHQSVYWQDLRAGRKISHGGRVPGSDRCAHPVVSSSNRSVQLRYDTYDHRYWKARDPVRSPIDKPVTAKLVVGWVTTSESLVLYVFLVVFVLLCCVGAVDRSPFSVGVVVFAGAGYRGWGAGLPGLRLGYGISALHYVPVSGYRCRCRWLWHERMPGRGTWLDLVGIWGGCAVV